jgi:hypothetical protein
MLIELKALLLFLMWDVMVFGITNDRQTLVFDVKNGILFENDVLCSAVNMVG